MITHNSDVPKPTFFSCFPILNVDLVLILKLTQITAVLVTTTFRLFSTENTGTLRLKYTQIISIFVILTKIYGMNFGAVLQDWSQNQLLRRR